MTMRTHLYTDKLKPLFMNKLMTLFLGAASIAALASCSSTKNTATISDLNGEWSIAAIDGKTVESPENQKNAFLGFDSTTGKVYGNASCNSITGGFDTKAEPGKIDLSRLGSTMMMCPDMTLETALLKALSKVKGYELTKNGDIALTNEKGKEIVLLRHREPAATADILKGEWKVTEINNEATDSLPGAPFIFAFNDNSFSCSTDCNNLMGEFTATANGLKFGNLASTRMACPDSKVEQAINAILPKVVSYGKLAGGGIGFYDAQNNLLLLLEQ